MGDSLAPLIIHNISNLDTFSRRNSLAALFAIIGHFFKESLAIDRAKEEAKKDEEKRVQQEIEREELMRLAEQKKEAHEKEMRTAIQKSIQVRAG